MASQKAGKHSIVLHSAHTAAPQRGKLATWHSQSNGNGRNNHYCVTFNGQIPYFTILTLRILVLENESNPNDKSNKNTAESAMQRNGFPMVRSYVCTSLYLVRIWPTAHLHLLCLPLAGLFASPNRVPFLCPCHMYCITAKSFLCLIEGGGFTCIALL